MEDKHLFYQTYPCSIEQFINAYELLSSKEEYHLLLESGRGGRYSIAGLKPKEIVKANNDGVEVKASDGDHFIPGDPLKGLYSWMEPYTLEKQPDLPDFQGGAIGFISYDYARYIEKLPTFAMDDLAIPQLYFFIYDQWVVFDHRKEQLWLMVMTDQNSGDEFLNEWTSTWKEVLNKKKHDYLNNVSTSPIDICVSMDEPQFKEAVEKIQNYISQGDVFQVNLSVRQNQALLVHPFEVYKQLRTLNPSPYMSYIQTPEFQIVSGSPELLVKKNGEEVSTRPIAGTRSRGKDEMEDEQLANELIENEKERAEHVMLVDLERNDLGRVCEYGTVEVNEFMVIEKYSHVMHIVSNVQGRLAENKSGYDLIRSVFPGGTITGAPKVRTMEIIEELEPVRRGIYTGSVGWIGFNGDMELNIVIRTMLVQKQQAYIQAGAGVVIDSNPKYEYRESLKKARALWNAKELAEEKGGNEHDSNDR
ncbi:para-aminobenzoate synthetase component 1 [Bacillus pakistanensis]|uniref:aminodeoxychorismate synthase n=1 Tax=Rossellomorea pakistanensis TaxID=992288 RepID=A0ABS2NK15_9BACI|nr:para-aminobenzoate synthetase component 1 [Bacillus pakistanensis]